MAGGLLGLGVGLGILALVPGVPALGAALARLEDSAPRRTALRVGSGLSSWRDELAARLAWAWQCSSFWSPRLASELAAAEMEPVTLASEAIVGSFGGALLPWVCEAVLIAGGAPLAASLVLVASGVLATGGLCLPVLALRARAAANREHMRHSLSGFCDLVSLSLAAGAGVEQALEAAQIAGEDWAIGRIGKALRQARLSGQEPWESLVSLGEALGVPELAELGANLALAGGEGARVRATLSAKAASLRRHELSEAETAANTLTEKMFVPGALLLMGFLVFLGYPAMERIFGAL